MSKSILYGGGYQAVNFTLLIVQALFLPRYLGLEQYGSGLYLLLPVLFLGGVWEPIAQRFCISGDGIPSAWWKRGIPVVFLGYLGCLFFLVPPGSDGVFVYLLGMFFLGEYIFSIYCVAVLQAQKNYALIFFLSLSGLVLSGATLTVGNAYWLVCLFYSAYFLPVFLYGILVVKGRGGASVTHRGSLGGVLDAISTRLFYVFVNNFYVILIGVFFGPAKAAVFRIVISFSSAFRFCNPLSIGHFYSMVHGTNFKKKIQYSLLPLAFFYIGVLVVWALLPWLAGYGQALLGENYYAVHDFFLDVLWFIPLYLWSPYLSIVFFASLGWKIIFCISAVALSIATVFIYFDNLQLFFGAACALYCSFILLSGMFKEMRG